MLTIASSSLRCGVRWCIQVDAATGNLLCCVSVVRQAQLAESQAGALAAENRAFNALQKQRALMTELHVMRGYRLESGTNLETTLSRLDSTDSIFTSKSYALQ